MAIRSRYNFVGGYENDTRAGVLHVADHHVSPGKKQWTWGNGDFGQAWDRNLTDEDGPYIELMTGVYTENQPDFSWLKPFEEKVFTQYFMPYKKVGGVKKCFDLCGFESGTDFTRRKNRRIRNRRICGCGNRAGAEWDRSIPRTDKTVSCGNLRRNYSGVSKKSTGTESVSLWTRQTAGGI